MKRFFSWCLEHSDKLKNIFTVLAIIIGGWWTFLTFSTLQQKEIADLTLQKTKEELSGKLSLDFEINAKQINSNTSGEKDLIIELDIKNNGSRFIPFKFDTSSLAIYEIGASYNVGNIRTSKYYLNSYLLPETGCKEGDSLETEFCKNHIMQPYSTKQLSYFTHLAKPGEYLISFKCRMDSISESHVNSIAKSNNNKNYWIATKYITVE